MAKCIWIGIGITIPQESDLFATCCSVSKVLADKCQSTHIINKIKPPHINLYDLDVPHNNLEIVGNKLENLLKSYTGFEIEIGNLEMFNFGVVYLSVKKSSTLCDLQEKIIKTVSLLKGGCICADYLKSGREYTQGQKEMLKLHGNPFVLGEFNPHITVGFLRTVPLNINNLLGNNVRTIKLYVDKIHLRWQLNQPNQPVLDYREYKLS